jgi:hypothetical protein
LRHRELGIDLGVASRIYTLADGFLEILYCGDGLVVVFEPFKQLSQCVIGSVGIRDLYRALNYLSDGYRFWFGHIRSVPPR